MTSVISTIVLHQLMQLISHSYMRSLKVISPEDIGRSQEASPACDMSTTMARGHVRSLLQYTTQVEKRKRKFSNGWHVLPVLARLSTRFQQLERSAKPDPSRLRCVVENVKF